MPSIQPELSPGPLSESSEIVGAFQVNHFALALRGLDISRAHGGMDDRTHGIYRSRFSQLGNQTPGPEPFGVDGAGESGQE